MVFFKSRQKKIRGFLYVTENDDLKLFESLVGGKFIKPDRNPPWLVVNHELDGVLVTEWPGRLLKVQVLNQSNEKDINKGLVKGVHYTRTLGVEILEELSTEVLFNPKGSMITRILDFASTMNEDDVNKLSEFEITKASKIYSNAWDEWLKIMEPESIHLNQNHSNTLAIFANNSRSTLNQSFSVISNIVGKRAVKILGKNAYTIDEDDESILDKSWSHASTILLQAAMAYNGREFITNEEIAILLTPWNSVANISPKTMSKIKPYTVVFRQENKYFSVNTKYLKLFESMKIDSSNMFFKADPYMCGLHSDDSDDIPHFQYFENCKTDQLVVKDSISLKLDDINMTKQQVEEYFESLEVGIGFILDCVEDLNNWAKQNYLEGYMPNLLEDIGKIRATHE
ncbi:MAG: hypothetical protein COA99_13675 [Moraxellaceae bacterium]|nr:MAG: hypothetical protein COA99_13675 [Moraxellaceae bacterium]